MSASAKLPYFDLDRRFRAVEETSTKVDDAILAALEELGHGTSRLNYRWVDLLKRRQVVILAEPGSGKTRELEETAARLRSEGRTAFFIRIDQLIGVGLTDALGSDLAAEFRRWQKGNGEAFFFLDSVDEAKLQRTADFYNALAKFALALGAAGRARAHVYLSSRVSEWRHDTDRTAVAAQLCEPLKTHRELLGGKIVTVPAEELLVVRLENLSPEQTESFARHLGTKEPERFIAEIDRAFAWEFARRPADVIDLANYWNERLRLGTLTDIVQAHVRRNLREDPKREREAPVTLTEADAMAGAKALAAAVAFCRQSAFLAGADTGALDARDCLPASWQPAAVPVLLSRPLFDDASFGKRQFHQRRAVEYLTSEWMGDRMRAGAPTHSLRALFFDEKNGTLRPSLAPAAAWICAADTDWGQEMRSWVLKAEPGIHFRFGDPLRLATDYRRSTLHAIAAAYSDRARAWIEADDQTLSRFATADLAADIGGLFRKQTTVRELRYHLMQMAAMGRLTGCVDDALAVVADPTDNDSLRVAALEIIKEADEGARLPELIDIIRGLPTFSETLGHGLIRAVYPSVLKPADFIALVAKIQDSSLPTRVGVLRGHLRENLPAVQSGEVLRGMVELIQAAPQATPEPGSLPLSLEHSDLAGALPPVMLALLANAKLTDCEEEDLAFGLLVFGRIAHEFEAKENAPLMTATLRHPGLRRRYFKQCIALTRRAAGHEVRRWFFMPFHHDALLKADETDLAWLLQEVQQTNDPQARQTFLNLAMELWRDSGQPRAAKRKLEAAVADDAALTTLFAQYVRGARLAPLHWWWRRNVTYRFDQRWWWQRWQRRLSDAWDQGKMFVKLTWRWRQIASGDDAGLLAWLAREGDGETNDRWTVKNWDGLAPKYGPLVSWAARRGCRLLWRRHRPRVPAANPDQNHTANTVVVGLNGLQLEWEEDRTAFLKMSADDAALATLYAVNELNTPPRWLDDLASAQPNAVSTALIECIREEWKGTLVYGVLARALNRAEGYGDVVKPGVLALMKEGDPREAGVLDLALRLLLPAYGSDIAPLAAARVRALNIESPSMALWVAAWMRIDADSALSWLEGLPTKDPLADRLVVLVCNSLHGGEMIRPQFDLSASYMRPAALRRLIALAYRHVPVKEDRPHRGGTFTPTARDHAEEFRSALINALAEQSGPEVVAALSELAADASLPEIRDYVLHLHDTRLRQGIEPDAWTPLQVRQYAEQNEAKSLRQIQPDEISVPWLEAANERYRQADTPPMYRVFQAMRELSKELGRPFVLNSPAADKITSWFVANTKPGAHAIGALFTGAFYFDASFWELTIPIFYGIQKFDPLDFLKTMPEPIKKSVWGNPTSRAVLVHYWTDCFDFALGFDILRKGNFLDARGRLFLSNAERELTGAIAQLLLPRPNPKAILSFRMACEIFLKFFLVHQLKLTDDELKKRSHNLETLARECFKIAPLPEFEIIARGVVAFPAVSDRYTGIEKDLPAVFDGAFIAQLAAATVCRHLTGQDCRTSIVPVSP